MTDIPEWAREVALTLLHATPVFGADDDTYVVTTPTRDDIARALMDARDKALEDVAVVADEHVQKDKDYEADPVWCGGYDAACLGLAETIRGMKSTKQEGNKE